MLNVLWEHRGKLLFGAGVLVGLSSKVHVTIKKETVRQLCKNPMADAAMMAEEAMVDIADSALDERVLLGSIMRTVAEDDRPITNFSIFDSEDITAVWFKRY